MKFLLVPIILLFSIKGYAIQASSKQQGENLRYWNERYIEKYQKRKNLKKRSKISSKSMKAKNIRQTYSTQSINLDEFTYGLRSARLQTSICYSQGAIFSIDSNGGATTGIRVDVGSHFNLSDNWTTTTSVRTNLDKIDGESINAPFGLANIEARAYDFGIAQKLLLKSLFGQERIAPFIEAHIGRGFFTINETEQLTNGTATAKTEMLYTKLTGSFGLQFYFEQVQPFLRLEYGRMIFDDVIGYEVSEATGTSRSGNSVIEKGQNLQYTFNSFSAGLSFLF